MVHRELRTPSWPMKPFVASSVVAIVVCASAATAWAQDRPALPDGVSTYVPIVDSITVDGDLSDWADIASIVTSTGPTPPSDPANTGSVTWAVAAVDQTLVFSATVVDATIVAGQHGDDYWNEDSLELYVNFSDALDTTAYGPGIAQITISPVDIGNTDPGALTISGNNASDVSVTGFVFATDDGWGTEIAVGLDGLTVPAEGGQFGLQLQANGSSGGDRDTKLSWSVADVGDTSFSDPSVFGTGVFVVDDQAIADEPSTDTASVTEDSADEQTEDADSSVAVDPSNELVEEPAADQIAQAPTVGDDDSENRTLLIAAVVSAAAVMLGGFWFENRRRADELRHREQAHTTETEPRALVSAPAVDPEDEQPPPVP